VTDMPTGSTDPSPTTSGFDIELDAASAMTTPTTGKDVAWTQGDGSLQDRLTLQVERAPLEAINDVLARLEAGQVAGRAVLVP